MLKINNALSRETPPTAECFEWEGGVNWEDQTKEKCIIDWKEVKPRLKEDAGFSKEAAEIWKRYFDILFDGLKLLVKINDNEKTLREDAQDLYNRLFPEGILDRVALLDLLLVRPDDEKIDSFIDLVNTEAAREAAEAIFDYSAFSRRPDFPELVRLLDVNVCPYCGRAFTGTAKKKSTGKYFRTNQVDHFLPKSIYPQFALSLWNLIPSCASCNNRKNDIVTDSLYPYAQEMGDSFRLCTEGTDGLDYMISTAKGSKFRVAFKAFPESTEPGELELIRRARAEIDMLGLDALYASHKDYVRDIYRQRYDFDDAYIDSLIRTFPLLFRTREDVRALLYMKRIEKENIGSAPLDKLTRDIDTEISELLLKSKIII